MKERCRDGCRTSLLTAGVVFVPAIFHTLLPPCYPYITIHFTEMIFSTCSHTNLTAPIIGRYDNPILTKYGPRTLHFNDMFVNNKQTPIPNKQCNSNTILGMYVKDYIIDCILE